MLIRAAVQFVLTGEKDIFGNVYFFVSAYEIDLRDSISSLLYGDLEDSS